jgi:hypothetical protein
VGVRRLCCEKETRKMCQGIEGIICCEIETRKMRQGIEGIIGT